MILWCYPQWTKKKNSWDEGKKMNIYPLIKCLNVYGFSHVDKIQLVFPQFEHSINNDLTAWLPLHMGPNYDTNSYSFDYYFRSDYFELFCWQSNGRCFSFKINKIRLTLKFGNSHKILNSNWNPKGTQMLRQEKKKTKPIQYSFRNKHWL